MDQPEGLAVQRLQTLDELRVLGPVWIRELLKRRKFGRGQGQVVTFGEHQTALSNEGGC